MTLADSVERAAIRGCLDETLVVEAAAGTGKTTELVQRIVNLVACGRAGVDQIVAVTFTEKAAGELKLRLRSDLEKTRLRESDPARNRNLENALAHLEEAHVSTIHGFCADLLAERPVESGVDPRFKTLNESQAKQLYGEAFHSWFQQRLENPPEGLRRSLRRRSPNSDEDEGPVVRLEKAGWDILNWRDFRAGWRRDPFCREAAVDDLVGKLHALAEAIGCCSNKKRDGFYQDVVQVCRLSDWIRSNERVRPRDYDELEGRFADMAGDARFMNPPRRGYESNWRGVRLPDVRAAHAAFAADLENFVSAADADLASLLHAEILDSVDRFEQLKNRAGALDFVDLLVRARDLIRDCHEVRREFQGRFRYILVDEFQDTDPLQAEILLLLASADEPGIPWRAVRPVPGKLFVVGDPKQSIYRFRRADVGIYEDVKRMLLERGARLVRLTTSFRAVPSIQSLVNAAFAPEMNGDGEALQAGYSPLVPSRAERTGQPAIVVLPVPEPYGRNRKVALSAIENSLPGAVGAFVHWLVHESGWKVSERTGTGAGTSHEGDVPLQPRHVCILFRRFEKYGTDVTRAYVQALEAHSVPHLLVGGKSFHEREEIESLRAALAAVEWPDDELSVFATVRGPLFAVPDAALLEWKQRFSRLHPYRIPSEDLPSRLQPIRRALELLQALHRSRNRVPAADTIARLLLETRAHAGFALRPSGEQALANVLHVGEIARRYELSGGVSFRGFLAHLEDEAAAGETSEAPILEEGSDGVRLMTVHKAKGLEFPVVIVADITAPLVPKRAGRYIDPARGLCALRLGRWSPVEVLENEERELKRERAESVRLAYVAATRARDLLVIPAVGDEPLTERWTSTLNDAIFPAVEDRALPDPAPACPVFGDDSVFLRLDGEPPTALTVRPGLHTFEASGYGVVWWDPSKLNFAARPSFGLRQRELISKEVAPSVVTADMESYREWERRRAAAVEKGSRPAIVLRTATGDRPPDSEIELPDVPVVRIAPEAGRPGGARYGTLVHAVIATVPLDGGDAQIREAAGLQARILGATAEEADSAAALVSEALEHPLLERARNAWSCGRCRREVPVAATESDGALLEGVVDLAFEDESGWTVVDFKTGRDIERELGRYKVQVARYAAVVSRATSRPATPILMFL